MNYIKGITAMIMLCLSVTAWAKDNREEISIFWGFNIASNSAQTVRVITEELNKIQNKYRFVLASKPGAGGTIAAQAVAASPDNSLVAMSSSFIIRPYFEKGQPTQNLDNYTPILVQGTGQPLYFVSAKYQDLKSIIKKPNATIGVSGIGSISHLAANELVKLNPTITVINFKNQLEATVAAAGKHVDAAVTFYADAKSLLDDGRIAVLGYTGNKTQLNQPKKRLTEFKLPESARVTANYAIYASRSMNPERFKEINTWLTQVNQSPAVLDMYAKDQLNPVKLNLTESEVWYEVERRFWREAVAKIKVQ